MDHDRQQQELNDESLIDRAENDDDDNDDDSNNEIDGGEEEEEEDDPLAHLPDYVIARVKRLEELQASRDRIMEDYLRERAALEKKYEALVRPLHLERAAVVRGERDDAVRAAVGDNERADDEVDNDSGDGDRVRGIPQFWAAAMMNMDIVSEMISEEDVDCLELLTDITCADRDDGKGFTLTFHFQPNEYFANPVLTKSYEVPNLLLSDEPLIKNVQGTAIQWKKGKSLTHRTVTKKQRGKGKKAGQVRTITKQEEKESFFHWFTAPELPAMELMDEEEAERVEELFDSDYEVAQAFRNHLIPKAILWFTGRADEEEMERAVQGLAEVEAVDNPEA